MPERHKRRSAFGKRRECFRAGAKLHEPKIEVISVRCGNEDYDGYFCHPVDPKPGKWPAVLFLGGADAYAEEIYFGGKPMLERGWAMLLVDTPGRGSSIYLKGIKTRPDYEVPGKACIDYLVSRPEVDPTASPSSASAWLATMRREWRRSTNESKPSSAGAAATAFLMIFTISVITCSQPCNGCLAA